MFQFWKHSGYDVDLSQLKKKKTTRKQTENNGEIKLQKKIKVFHKNYTNDPTHF